MLTDAQCRNATCSVDKKRERLTDAGGLYLEVSPQGSKRWFWKIYKDGKESRMMENCKSGLTRGMGTA